MRLLSGPPKVKAGQILGVSVVRNEELRLPFFLDYHRQLGVDQFLIIENDSTDATLDFLLNESDCTVFQTRDSYSDSGCGIAWQNEILHRYAVGQWTLILDADELFVYAGHETIRLDEFVQSLSPEVNSVRSFMLDMYDPDQALGAVRYSSGDSFVEACGYFDRLGYEYATDGVYEGLPVRGGVRKRVFWASEDQPGKPPFLGKLPFVRWDQSMNLKASTHIIDGVRPSKGNAVIQHFKFLGDIAERVQEEVARNEHWDNSAQYRAYDNVLSDIAPASLRCEHSTRYVSSAQLADLKLIS